MRLNHHTKSGQGIVLVCLASAVVDNFGLHYDLTPSELMVNMTELISSDAELIALNQANMDAAIDNLIDHGFCVVENACSADLFSALLQESHELQAQFQRAAIAQGGHQQAIRGDCTRWLNPSDPAGGRYLASLEKLGQYLNQQLYTGIRHVEAHYASYAPGDYYARHRDNPAHQQARVISTVLYLNSHWDAVWHGQLQLQDTAQHWHQILPMPNRLVLFQSELLHEVCAASQPRNSIAGWLRRDDAVL